MTDAIQAYPLQWPAGWRRTSAGDRAGAKFNKKVKQYREVPDPQAGITRRERICDRIAGLTMQDATQRVLDELQAMGFDRDDVVISTNVELRRDGLPMSNRRAPSDPGAAVYWRKFTIRNGRSESRCMAVDRYDRVEDNLAAIAATLDAMRSIERHGGAAILDRAFQGFAALPAPESWWQVLGLSGPDAGPAEIRAAHRRLISEHHPDTGGDTDKAARINRARDQGIEAQQ